MGWRDKSDRLRVAAAARADVLRTNDTVAGLQEAAAAGIDRARNSDALSDIDLAALKDAAVSSSGVASRRGEVKRWRVARAAINPTVTATSVAKGVAAEIVRQKRSNTSLDARTESANTGVPGADDAPQEL